MSRPALVFGGASPEHEVSIRSAANALRYIKEVESQEILLVWISKEGEWFLQDDVARPRRRARLRPREGEGLYMAGTGEKLDVGLAYLFGHGAGCEDGTLQAFFDGAGIPFSGSDQTSSALCMAKARASKAVEGLCAGIPSLVVSECPRQEHLASLDLPCLVKPEASGSSVGISVLESFGQAETEAAFMKAKAFSPLVIFQKLVRPRRELECGVLQIGGDLVPLEICELKSDGDFLSYNQKYNMGDSYILCPAPLDAGLKAEVQTKAVLIARKAGCGGFLRVDFLYDLQSGTLLFNEINTIPGFTRTSHYPLMLERSGISKKRFASCVREAALGRPPSGRTGSG